MKKCNFNFLGICLNSQQATKQVFVSFSILLLSAFCASLQASMTFDFQEFTDSSNDYGGAGVEVSWSGSLNVEGLTRRDLGGHRVFFRTNENVGGSDNKVFAWVAVDGEPAFSGWAATGPRTSDAPEGAIIPDPIFDPQGALKFHFLQIVLERISVLLRILLLQEMQSGSHNRSLVMEATPGMKSLHLMIMSQENQL
jgi:hypothetical protein